MSTPRVTVCIPAYHSERYLADTLASVRAQTFRDWEIVLVEDGSRDGAERIVRDFAASVSQPVRYFRHDLNRGLSTTRNSGFQHARTDLLAILDADDLWRPDHLQLSLETLESSDADIVFSACQLFDSDTGAALGIRAPFPGSMQDFPRSLHDGRIVIQPSAVLLRREVIDHVGGFDPTFPICNDLEFWFRTAKLGGRFAYTGAITCDYRKHGAALSLRSADLVAECAQVHALHRRWPAVPRAQRRRELWRHHRNAARMLFHAQPLRSFKLLVRGLALQISA